MTCKGCGSGNTSDFSQKTHPHIFCNECKGHDYQHQFIDAKTWARWMDGDIDRPVREEQLDMFGEAA